MSVVLLPKIVAQVFAAAPSAKISLRSADAPVADALDSGACDIVFGHFGLVPDRLQTTTLFQERMVWVVRRGHELLNGPITPERLIATPQAVISVTGRTDTAHFMLENGLERQLRRDDDIALRNALGEGAATRRIALTVPDAPAALHYVCETDLAALLPRRLVAHFSAHYDLQTIEPPYASPASDMSMLWHRDFGEYPETKWLRSVVTDIARDLDAHPVAG